MSPLTLMTQDTVNLSLDAARALIADALVAAGTENQAADSVARALVAAEAEGQVGHGFSRLSDYAAQVKSGKVNGAASPGVERLGPSAIRVDAADGFAYPALDLAIAAGIEAARETGCATMSIIRSHHCGALSVQVEKLAEAGLVGIMVANSPPAIAPWGSNTPVYGTNPIAFSAPREGTEPLVIDLSLSNVARGKIMNARKLGKPIPEGWALDADGHPTTDPEAALAGSMVPIGGAKGTALALMVEILAASFTGANNSTGVSSFFGADGPHCGAGQFLMALRPDNAAAFANRLEPLLSQIAGLEGARLPGTRRIAAIKEAQAHGLDVPSAYIDLARRLANPDNA